MNIKSGTSKHKSDLSIKKTQEKLLVKRFFPFYMMKVKHVIHAVHRIHPKASYALIIKLLSIAIRRKLSANAVTF